MTENQRIRFKTPLNQSVKNSHCTFKNLAFLIWTVDFNGDSDRIQVIFDWKSSLFENNNGLE